MTRHLLPPPARKVLQLLFGLKPSPQSVWLFGSRANGRATPMSDTDLLVFANSAFVESLRASTSQPQDVDVLVAIDSDTIIYPWRQETGSLKSWQWHRLGDNAASYLGTKWIPDTELDDDDPDELRKTSRSAQTGEEPPEFGRLAELRESAIRLHGADA